jgi:hypothetical protein
MASSATQATIHEALVSMEEDGGIARSGWPAFVQATGDFTNAAGGAAVYAALRQNARRHHHVKYHYRPRDHNEIDHRPLR